jgi:hypothetical protein
MRLTEAKRGEAALQTLLYNLPLDLNTNCSGKY